MMNFDELSAQEFDNLIDNLELIFNTDLDKITLDENKIKKIKRFRAIHEGQREYITHIGQLQDKALLYQLNKHQYDSFLQLEYSDLIDKIHTNDTWQQFLFHKNDEGIEGKIENIVFPQLKELFTDQLSILIQFDTGNIIKIQSNWEDEQEYAMIIDGVVTIFTAAPKYFNLFWLLKILMDFESIVKGKQKAVKQINVIQYNNLFKDHKIADKLKVALQNESYIDTSGQWTNKASNKSDISTLYSVLEDKRLIISTHKKLPALRGFHREFGIILGKDINEDTARKTTNNNAYEAFTTLVEKIL
jgi:hypothetical protein